MSGLARFDLRIPAMASWIRWTDLKVPRTAFPASATSQGLRTFSSACTFQTFYLIRHNSDAKFPVSDAWYRVPLSFMGPFFTHRKATHIVRSIVEVAANKTQAVSFNPAPSCQKPLSRFSSSPRSRFGARVPLYQRFAPFVL